MEVHPYDHSANSEGAGQMSENILVEEYTLLEQVHIFGGVLDVFAVLYPQLQDIDFRTQATSLEVPVYLAQGATRHRAGSCWRRSGSTAPGADQAARPTSTPPGTAPCGSSPPSSTT